MGRALTQSDLLRRLNDWWRTRETLTREIVAAGPAAVPVLCAALAQRGRARTRALVALTRVDREVLRAVYVTGAVAVGDLGDLIFDDTTVAVGATRALITLGGDDAVPYLHPALKHPMGEVRALAARALGERRDAAALPSLLAMARRDGKAPPFQWFEMYGVLRPFGNTRQDSSLETSAALLATLRALGQIGDPQAVPVLGRALRSYMVVVQVAAAEALGDIGGERAVRLLCGQFDSEFEHVQQAVARALVQIGSPAVPAICSLLDDWQYRRRGHAISLLREIGDERAMPTLYRELRLRDSAVRTVAAQALKALEWQAESVEQLCVYALGAREFGLLLPVRDEALPQLCQLLTDGNHSMRRDAAQALGRLGLREALPTLKRRASLLFGERDAAVRGALVAAIGQIEQDTGATRRLPREAHTDMPSGTLRPRVDPGPESERRPRADEA